MGLLIGAANVVWAGPYDNAGPYGGLQFVHPYSDSPTNPYNSVTPYNNPNSIYGGKTRLSPYDPASPINPFWRYNQAYTSQPPNTPYGNESPYAPNNASDPYSSSNSANPYK